MPTRCSVFAAVLPVAIGAALPTHVAGGHRPRDPQVEQRCDAAKWPKRLPPFDSLADSAAAVGALAQLHDTGDTAVVVSLLYRKGAPPMARAVEPDTAPAVLARSVVRVLTPLLRPLESPDPMGAVRVRVRWGASTAVTVERSVYCLPRMVTVPGQAGMERFAVPLSPGDRMPAPGVRARTDTEISIDITGHVTGVRLLASSGIQELDNQIIQSQWNWVFLPARIDGLPVPSWIRTNGTQMRL